MPNGRVHAFSTIALAGVSAAALYQFNPNQEINIAAVSGVLSGLMLTPDLDVPAGSISQSFVRRKSGILFSLIWRIWWLPYAHIIPHRHWVSHFPLISTIIRIIYLGFLIGVITGLLSLVPGNDQIFPDIYHIVKEFALSLQGAAALAGLTLSDMLHYLLDRIF
ncbi:MAG: DUF2227 family putative metal-binding protein [Chloroflexota bacterium]